jgi:hypothetical protein
LILGLPSINICCRHKASDWQENMAENETLIDLPVDDLTSKQNDYAVFLPAISSFYATYVGRQRLCQSW